MRMSVISIPVRSCGFPCKVSPRNSGSKQVWRPIRPTAALSSCSTAPRGQKVSPTASGGREPWTVNRGGAGGGCLAVWSGQSHRCAVEVSTFSRSSTCAAGGLGLLQLPWPAELTECSEVALARCPRIPKLAPSRQKGSLPSCFSRLQLFATPWTIAQQAPLSMGFPRQDYWSGLPCPSPGDLPDPGIEPASPALADGFSTTETPGRPKRGSGVDKLQDGFPTNRRGHARPARSLLQ